VTRQGWAVAGFGLRYASALQYVLTRDRALWYQCEGGSQGCVMSNDPEDNVAVKLWKRDRTKWPPKFFEACSSSPHMEALGSIATIYNHLEQTLFSLILTYSQLDLNVAKSLFENMSTPNRIKFLQSCSENRTQDNVMHDHLCNFIKCFDIVAGNRNIVMHSVIRSTDDESVLWFSKANRSNPIVDKALLLDIDILRRTALDLQDVDVYGARIFLYCHLRAPWSKHYKIQKEEGLGLVPSSAAYLEMLALPSKLLKA
jgi:hypothetical protein